MVDLGGLAGTGGPGNLFKGLGASPLLKEFPGPRGRADPTHQAFPGPRRDLFYCFQRFVLLCEQLTIDWVSCYPI
jgi:hypothetical protein